MHVAPSGVVGTFGPLTTIDLGNYKKYIRDVQWYPYNGPNTNLEIVPQTQSGYTWIQDNLASPLTGLPSFTDFLFAPPIRPIYPNFGRFAPQNSQILFRVRTLAPVTPTQHYSIALACHIPWNVKANRSDKHEPNCLPNLDLDDKTWWTQQDGDLYEITEPWWGELIVKMDVGVDTANAFLNIACDTFIIAGVQTFNEFGNPPDLYCDIRSSTDSKDIGLTYGFINVNNVFWTPPQYISWPGGYFVRANDTISATFKRFDTSFPLDYRLILKGRQWGLNM
jgi:hypothetical protein